MNVTNSIPQPERFKTRFFGPNSDKFFRQIHGLNDFRSLSRRELQILILVRDGLSSSQIAKKLVISLNTAADPSAVTE